MKNYHFIGMETGGSSATQNKHGSRRVWTKKEEESLLDVLDDVVAHGMRCDTGSFKSGTMTIIERALAEKCPNSGLRINPHIESKLKMWKKQYEIVYDMLNKSGFGWNEEMKCVEVDSLDVWQSYVEVWYLNSNFIKIIILLFPIYINFLICIF